MLLKRRFLKVGDRRVHYVCAGAGPPVVLIHSSPANVRLLDKEIHRLSADFTVFAFDTPGFGLSDPLPGQKLTVADLADAMADTLAAIGMPRCPIFGTHTGAAIALELGVRHPGVATGLVLDGIPAFTDEECAQLFGDYFRALPLSDLGRQYSETWTRFRDQSIWFPWTHRFPEQLNAYDLSPPHSTHLWVSMYFEAAEHYSPAYRAASFYGEQALHAAAALTLPAVICATTSDMLYPHMARLPALKPGQLIVDIGDSYERKRELIAASFVRFGADGPAPVDNLSIVSSTCIERQFVDGRQGQLHFRHCGDRATPAVLLIHDAPGSSEQSEDLIARLAHDHFVIAPDLPGHGESDAPTTPPTLAEYASDLAQLLQTLGVKSAAVYGIGFGSSAALAFADSYPEQVIAITLDALALPDAVQAAAMKAHYAPPIAIEPDGAHWYRTWLMLRDAQVYFPWYEPTLAALRRVPADFSARPLHRHTMDVMRGHASYGHLIHAALAEDAARLLARLHVRPTIVDNPATPLSAYNNQLRALVAALDISAA